MSEEGIGVCSGFGREFVDGANREPNGLVPIVRLVLTFVRSVRSRRRRKVVPRLSHHESRPEITRWPRAGGTHLLIVYKNLSATRARVPRHRPWSTGPDASNSTIPRQERLDTRFMITRNAARMSNHCTHHGHRAKNGRRRTTDRSNRPSATFAPL